MCYYPQRPYRHTCPTRRSSDLKAAGHHRQGEASFRVSFGELGAHRHHIVRHIRTVVQVEVGETGHARYRFANLPIDDHTVQLERSEEHTSELQTRFELVCRMLL